MSHKNYTDNRLAHLSPRRKVVTQPVSRVFPASGESGSGEDHGSCFRYTLNGPIMK